MRTASEAERLGKKSLRRILAEAQERPGLRKLGPRGVEWRVELKLLSAPAMKKLNASYRGKDYATDVLSFPAPEVFRAQGRLGDLAICLPVLRRQAKEAGHSEARELEVLVVHGVLHLLGLDHERGEDEARRMAAWERKLLGALAGAVRSGLIARSQSGIPRKR